MENNKSGKAINKDVLESQLLSRFKAHLSPQINTVKNKKTRDTASALKSIRQVKRNLDSGYPSICFGRNNHISGGIHINHYAAPATPETKPATLTQRQCYAIYRLVNEIIDLEAQYKEKPRSYRAVWGSLKKRFNVEEYRDIQTTQFDDALVMLEKQRDRLIQHVGGSKSQYWRNRQISIILAGIACNNIEEKLTQHMLSTYGHSTLKKLNDGDLENVLKWVRQKSN